MLNLTTAFHSLLDNGLSNLNREMAKALISEMGGALAFLEDYTDTKRYNIKFASLENRQELLQFFDTNKANLIEFVNKLSHSLNYPDANSMMHEHLAGFDFSEEEVVRGLNELDSKYPSEERVHVAIWLVNAAAEELCENLLDVINK